MLWWSWWE